MKGLFFASAWLLFTGCYFGGNDSQSQVAVWNKIGPGGGGAVFLPTFSYSNPNHFLLRCDMTGAYLTNDGGDSYQQINYPNGSSSFAYDERDSNTVYIGSSTLNRSVNGGKTWARIFPAAGETVDGRFSGDHAEYSISTGDNAAHEPAAINAIRVDPVNKGSLYFCMGRLFFYSKDDGRSWNKKQFSQPLEYLYTDTGQFNNEVFIFSADSIFSFNKKTGTVQNRSFPAAMTPATSFCAGVIKNTQQPVFYALHNTVAAPGESFGHSTIWISNDKGNSWSPLQDPLLVNKAGVAKPSFIKIACSEADAANAYVVANQYVQDTGNKRLVWYGAFKTADAGATWNWVWKAGGGAGVYAVNDAADAVNLQDAWVHKAFGGEFIQLMDVGVSPVNGNIAIVTDWYRSMKTTDGGKSWKEIYSTENNDSSYTSRGLDVTTAYGVHFDPFDTAHIAISYTDIGFHHSFDGGKSWRRSVTGVPAEWKNTCYSMVFDSAVKGKIWSVWSGMHDIPRGKMTRDPQWKTGMYTRGGVCVSLDAGLTWRPSVEGMGMNSPATSIIIDPASSPGNRTLYVTVYNKGVFKSTDDGKTWKLKNNGIGPNTCAFEITLAADGSLFLVISPTPQHKNGQKARDIYSGEVYISRDAAESWSRLTVTNGLLFPNGIGIDPFNPRHLYLGCWSDVYLSDLVGRNVVHATGGDSLLSMQGGIFMSEDGGKTWATVLDKNQYVYDVTVDPYHPGRIYANTFNQAAWQSNDYGKNWKKLKGYDFHWGHRVIIDENNHEKIYLSTYGSSVWHGVPLTEQ